MLEPPSGTWTDVLEELLPSVTGEVLGRVAGRVRSLGFLSAPVSEKSTGQINSRCLS